MATVKDIYNYIDSIAPFNTQEDWDNSGLLVGNESAEVKKIFFTLDITTDTIDQAVEIGADLIVSHHPLIFRPVANVMYDSLVYKVVKNQINVISAHTTFDKAINGINDVLCRKIGFDNFVKIDGTYLNIIELDEPIKTLDFVTKVKNSLDVLVRYNSTYKSNITKIGVCGGSGCDLLEIAKEHGCDAFLTGDASHHKFIDANEMGVFLISAGHFETENLAMEPLMNSIASQFDVPCVLAHQSSPYSTL